MSLSEKNVQDTQEAAVQTSTTDNKSSESNKTTTDKVSQKVIRRNNSRMFLDRLRRLELHQADAMIVTIRIAQEKKKVDTLTTEEKKVLNAYLCGGFTKSNVDDHNKVILSFVNHRRSRVRPLLDKVSGCLSSSQMPPTSEVLYAFAFNFEVAELCLKFIDRL